jgi:hypothetical protein
MPLSSSWLYKAMETSTCDTPRRSLRDTRLESGSFTLESVCAREGSAEVNIDRRWDEQLLSALGPPFQRFYSP